eukprot:UN23118
MVAMGLDTLVYDDFSGSDNEAIYGWETFTFKTSLGEQDYEYCDYETGNEDRQDEIDTLCQAGQGYCSMGVLAILIAVPGMLCEFLHR